MFCLNLLTLYVSLYSQYWKSCTLFSLCFLPSPALQAPLSLSTYSANPLKWALYAYLDGNCPPLTQLLRSSSWNSIFHPYNFLQAYSPFLLSVDYWVFLSHLTSEYWHSSVLASPSLYPLCRWPEWICQIPQIHWFCPDFLSSKHFLWSLDLYVWHPPNILLTQMPQNNLLCNKSPNRTFVPTTKPMCFWSPCIWTFVFSFLPFFCPYIQFISGVLILSLN